MLGKSDLLYYPYLYYLFPLLPFRTSFTSSFAHSGICSSPFINLTLNPVKCLHLKCLDVAGLDFTDQRTLLEVLAYWAVLATLTKLPCLVTLITGQCWWSCLAGQCGAVGPRSSAKLLKLLRKSIANEKTDSFRGFNRISWQYRSHIFQKSLLTTDIYHNLSHWWIK